jgi:hypothetical protein
MVKAKFFPHCIIPLLYIYTYIYPITLFHEYPMVYIYTQYMHMYIRTYTYIHTSMHACMHAYIHTYSHVISHYFAMVCCHALGSSWQALVHSGSSLLRSVVGRRAIDWVCGRPLGCVQLVENIYPVVSCSILFYPILT